MRSQIKSDFLWITQIQDADGQAPACSPIKLPPNIIRYCLSESDSACNTLSISLNLYQQSSMSLDRPGLVHTISKLTTGLWRTPSSEVMKILQHEDDITNTMSDR
jgi:hypothetical protein